MRRMMMTIAGMVLAGGAFNTGYVIDFRNHTAEVFHWQAPGSNADTKRARAIHCQAMREFLAKTEQEGRK